MDCLNETKKEFKSIFENAVTDEISVAFRIIGEIPCAGEVDKQKQKALTEVCKATTESITEKSVVLQSASTDCNIPLSLGIPAVCIGVYRGTGMHTREEYIESESLKTGFEISIKMITALLSEDPLYMKQMKEGLQQ